MIFYYGVKFIFDLFWWILLLVGLIIVVLNIVVYIVEILCGSMNVIDKG